MDLTNCSPGTPGSAAKRRTHPSSVPTAMSCAPNSAQHSPMIVEHLSKLCRRQNSYPSAMPLKHKVVETICVLPSTRMNSTSGAPVEQHKSHCCTLSCGRTTALKGQDVTAVSATQTHALYDCSSHLSLSSCGAGQLSTKQLHQTSLTCSRVSSCWCSTPQAGHPNLRKKVSTSSCLHPDSMQR